MAGTDAQRLGPWKTRVFQIVSMRYLTQSLDSELPVQQDSGFT